MMTGASERDLTNLLGRHVPSVLADSIVRRATRSAGGDARRLVDEIRTGVRLFAEPTAQSAILGELDRVTGGRAEVIAEKIDVSTEADVSRARLRAREMALALGGGAFGAQRVSTAVSELARNIVSYAGRGYVQLVPRPDARPMLTVRAVDEGPGIVDVSSVLAGTYKSKTGLGRGLSGVKRLAARFEVRTGRGGTTVDCDIQL